MAIIQQDSQPFQPYARLMNILGDQLITDKIVAVIELLKNCYDADSPRAEVRFGNMPNFGFNDLPIEEQAYIEIRDYGCGMNLSTIKDVWLRPATPNKIDKKNNKESAKTKKGRVIQGEKGIGRFAIHKLGEKIVLYTKALGENEIKLEMDFSEYDPEKANLFNQNMPNNNSVVLSQKKRLILFLVGFSYTGLLLLSLIWSILLAPTSNGDIIFTEMMIEFLTYVSLFIFMFLICLDSKKYFANELSKPSNYGKGFLCGLLILGVEVLISYLIQLFYEPETNANQALVELLSTNYPTLMFLITCILGPICEELTYRVGLFGFLKQKNKVLAYILEGFVFAFVHISFTDTTFLAELSAFPI